MLFLTLEKLFVCKRRKYKCTCDNVIYICLYIMCSDNCELCRGRSSHLKKRGGSSNCMLPFKYIDRPKKKGGSNPLKYDMLHSVRSFLMSVNVIVEDLVLHVVTFILYYLAILTLKMHFLMVTVYT